MNRDQAFKKQQENIAKERAEDAKKYKGKTIARRPVHELNKEQGIKSKVAKKMAGKGGFIERLEAHKREAESFDNGTWKPSKKGESFIEALERHKSNRDFW